MSFRTRWRTYAVGREAVGRGEPRAAVGRILHDGVNDGRRARSVGALQGQRADMEQCTRTVQPRQPRTGPAVDYQLSGSGCCKEE